MESVARQRSISPTRAELTGAVPSKSTSELRTFRKKTVSRVHEKRREYSEERELEHTHEKIKDAMFRTKWRERVKKDTLLRVTLAVDRMVLEDTIKHRPNVVLNLKLGELMNDQKDFEMSLSELVSEVLPKEDYAAISARNKFLYGDSTEEDSADDNPKNSFEPERLDFSSPHARFILQNKGFKSPQSLNNKNHSNSKRSNSRKRTQSGSPNVSHPLDHPEDIRRIKTVGLMAKVINKSEFDVKKKASDDSQVNLTSTPSLTIKDLRTSKAGSNSKSNMYTTDNSPSTADIPPVSTAHTGLGTPPTQPKNQLFASLADCLFLIGPSKAALDEAVRLELSVSGADSIVPIQTSPKSDTGSAENGSQSPNSGAAIMDTDIKLPPTILFMTECNNPNEMLSLLPTYCYPR